jgi:hypothetical protein
MRKLWLLVMIIFLCSLAVELFAESKQDIYYQTIQIIKILKHRLGYKVYYVKNDMRVATTYIPLRWMKEVGGKGQIVWGKDKAYPYMSIYWTNNKFKYVKLYVKPINDVTWGLLDARDEEIRDYFNVEELKLEF